MATDGGKEESSDLDFEVGVRDDGHAGAGRDHDYFADLDGCPFPSRLPLWRGSAHAVEDVHRDKYSTPVRAEEASAGLFELPEVHFEAMCDCRPGHGILQVVPR